MHLYGLEISSQSVHYKASTRHVYERWGGDQSTERDPHPTARYRSDDSAANLGDVINLDY